MRYDLPAESGVSGAELSEAVERLVEVESPRLRRLWNYYRNPMLPAAVGGSEGGGSERPYRQAQEWGLPARITGFVAGEVGLTASRSQGTARKEVVVENDIGWRVDTMVDHLFGRPIILTSRAADVGRRAVLTELLNSVMEVNGSLALLQQMALLGAVYGYVDVLVKLDSEGAVSLRKELGGDAWGRLEGGIASGEGGTSGGVKEGVASSGGGSAETGRGEPGSAERHATGETSIANDTGPGISPDRALIERLARLVRFEIVHPSRALPLDGGGDSPRAYGQMWEVRREVARGSKETWRWWRRDRGGESEQVSRHVELITRGEWFRLVDGVVTKRGVNSLGRVPVAHVQNLAMPFEYAGRGDVEGLIPLQDELNTRLSDRAYRITMQSFKMFLGKGIDNFLTAPVGPGRMWQTDNDEAEIKEFGGDQQCPSEESHISDIREAMDKASGVPPVAAGTIRDRVGQLSSAAALRVTLQALLAKTERKRATYGRGLAEMCELALGWLDVAGVLGTGREERGIDITWPSSMPENSLERLREAEIKARLGVPKETVLREIGY